MPQDLVLGLRPECLIEPIGNGVSDLQLAEVDIDLVEPAGADTYVVTQLGGKQVTARLGADTKAVAGRPMTLGFDLSKASFFDAQSGLRLN